MPARKLYPYELEKNKPKTVVYQDYVSENTSVASVKEVLFFVNIACFCVFLAVFSFIFLALKFNTVISFGLAIAFSLLALKVQRTIKKKKLKKNPSMNRRFFYLFFRFDGVVIAILTSSLSKFYENPITY